MKYLSLFFILFFMFGCSNEKKRMFDTRVIKIDVEDEDTSNLPKLSLKSVIALEENSESLFGFIDVIEYIDNRIYLLDIYSSKSVMVYSEEGNFINKTKLGKGPEEMIKPFSLFVDKNNKNVLIYDQALHYIYLYDLDLNFLSRNKYDGVPFSNFAKINKDELLVRSHFYQDYVYSLYSLKPSVDSIRQYIPDMKYSGGQRLSRSISIGNRILLIAPYDYNVYQFLDGNIRSKYYFDFGKFEITKDDIKKNGIKGNWKLIRAGQRVFSLNGIAESDNFLLFQVYHKSEPIYYIHSFKKGKTYRLNDYFEKGILPKCAIRGVVEKDVFYAMVEPIDMMEFQESTNQKLVENEIEIQQNPYIITFSISE